MYILRVKGVVDLILKELFVWINELVYKVKVEGFIELEEVEC